MPPMKTEVPPITKGSGRDGASAVVAERLVPKIEMRAPGAIALEPPGPEA